MAHYFRLAFLLLCFSSSMFDQSLYCQSSPPLQSNDPGTPGPGNWEINIFTSLERSAVFEEWQVPQFDINFGVGDRIQLTVSVPFVIEYEEGSMTRRAFDGAELGVKYRFLDNPGSTGPNFSVFPQIYFAFEEKRTTEWSLPIQWHQEWSPIGLTAEIGHVWVDGKSEGWEGGLGVGLLLDPWELLAEWHTGVREAPFDLRDPMVNLGFTYEWSESVSLLASFGKSLQHQKDETTTWFLAGFQFRF